MSSIKLESNASGTGVFTIASPNSNTNRTLSIPDGTGSIVVNGVNGSLVSETAKAYNWNGLTTNTFIEFTGIPSWVKRITVMFSGVSTSGTSIPLIQIGDLGGFEITGYVGTGAIYNTGGQGSQAFTAGFGLSNLWAAANPMSGVVSIVNISGNTWVAGGQMSIETTLYSAQTAGTKTLSDVLTQIRITTVNPGTDTFDAGTINILYE